jgi:hypothetical protein
MSVVGTFWPQPMPESVMRSKAEVERHHDMDRVGNLLSCADRRRSVVGLAHHAPNARDSHGALNAADGCPLSGGNRSPRVHRGIEAIDPKRHGVV